MIDRGEASGLALAIAGHAALFVLLSMGFVAAQSPAPPETPMEVSISDMVGLESQAPVVTHEEAAALKAPEAGPPVPDTPPPSPAVDPEPARPKPEPPKPSPAPAATPAPPTRPVPAAAPRPQPSRDRRPTGALDGLDIGATDKPSNSRSTAPPAAVAGPAVQSALIAEVIRQIKPHWRPPSGADSDQLRTTVHVRLAPDGSIVGAPTATQTGITASNSAQAALHKERAIRAVMLAAPFKLPDKYYNAWKTIEPTLFEGL